MSKFAIFMIGMAGSFAGTLLANVIINNKEGQVINGVVHAADTVVKGIKDGIGTVIHGAKTNSK